MVSGTTIGLCFSIVALGMQGILHSFWFKGVSEARARALLRTGQGLFFAAIGVTLARAAVRTYLQYQAWHADPFAKLFLPPYRPIEYFVHYAGLRFFAPALIVLVAGLASLFAARWLNKKYEERFFEREEPFFFAAAILATGYPVFLFYAIVVGLLGIGWSAFSMARGEGRASFYFLWFPAAIFAILVAHWFLPPALLVQFNL